MVLAEGSRVGRRTWSGVAVALLTLLVFTLAMLPLRAHLSVATDALVLIVPVVAGVAVGGFVSGVVGAACGFLVYDWFFIPPYGTLTVGPSQDWVALFVYVAVVLIVARVVSVQQIARGVARQREDAIRHLFVVTEQLITSRPLEEMLMLVATTVHETFRTRWVALLMPRHDRLEIAAVAGAEFTDDDRAVVEGQIGSPQPMTLVGADHVLGRLALITDQGPVGQLAIAGAQLAPFERELLSTFANQAAFAIERSQLREQALRAQALEEADRWRSALMGAVSHDLRTPLSSMKLAVSTLRHEDSHLSAADRDELLEMIEDQGDHLAHLVTNLLDMARLEAGTLALHLEPHAVGDILDAALRSSGSLRHRHHVVMEIEPDLPLVDVDLVLISQVVANLLTNAAHHGPDGSPITIRARREGDRVLLAVADRGPGVAPQDRERIFHMLDRRAGSGRAGLALSIARAFVAAHGGTLRVDDEPKGGACFTFDVAATRFDGVDE